MMALCRLFSRSHSQPPNRSPRQHPHRLHQPSELRGEWMQGISLWSRHPLCAESAQLNLYDHQETILANDTPMCRDAGSQNWSAIDGPAAQFFCSQEHHQQLHTPSDSHHSGLEGDVEELLQILCHNDQLPAALEALSRVDTPLSINICMCILKACIKLKFLPLAMHVYTHAAKHRNPLTGVLGDYLVITLAKCGAIEDARKLARTLKVRTIFSWTAIISAYVDCCQGHEALEMYHQMLMEGVQPNDYTFVSLLKACGAIRNLHQGRRIQSAVCKKGLELDGFIQNTLISMYSKCNAVKEAESMFGTLLKQDTMTWNVMFSTYVERHQGDKALLLYRQMWEEGINPDKDTFSFALQACGLLVDKRESVGLEEKFIKAPSLEITQALHADARKQGFVLDDSLGNNLISAYGRCGALLEAEVVFCSLFSPDTMAWTALLAAYVEQGKGSKALRLYRQMLEEGVSLGRHPLVYVLQASSVLDKEDTFIAESSKSLPKQIREALHACARKKGFTSDVFVVTTLVNLYGKSGELAEARNAFCASTLHDIVLWTAMLSAYVEQGQGEKVLQLYVHLQREGVCPDQHILVISLQACSLLAEKEDALEVGGLQFKVRALEIGEALHSDVCRRRYAENVFVCNALVVMYGKCGDIFQAEDVFNAMTIRDLVTWTAMLSAYVEQGQGEQVLLLYKQIGSENLFVDDRVLLCMLQACCEVGGLETCNQLHFDVFCAGYDLNFFIVASSIHAYGDCTSMLDAQSIFDGLPQPDVASYTAWASGYAGEGDSIASMHVFERMLLANVTPNSFTFTAIFSACSHTGLVDLALEHFDFMKRGCRISPDLRHYGSLVDLLGRAGDFNKVEDLLKMIPLQADLRIWSCLLAACRVHGNLELGKHAFEKAISLQPSEAATYDLMINMFIDAGLEDCSH